MSILRVTNKVLTHDTNLSFHREVETLLSIPNACGLFLILFFGNFSFISLKFRLLLKTMYWLGLQEEERQKSIPISYQRRPRVLLVLFLTACVSIIKHAYRKLIREEPNTLNDQIPTVGSH